MSEVPCPSVRRCYLQQATQAGLYNARVCCKDWKCPSMRPEHRSRAMHCPQGTRTQEQAVSMTKPGLTAGTSRMQAAVQRSRAARLQATAQRRSAPPEVLMLLTMTMGRAPRQARKLRRSRQPRDVPRRKSTAAERLTAAAREAQRAQSKAQRASALAQKRSQLTAAAPSAATAAPERSTAARTGTAARRQHDQAEKLSVRALTIQHGSCPGLKRVSKQRRHAPGKENTGSEKLHAVAIEAHLLQYSSQHVDGVSLEQAHTTESSSPADESGEPSDASCSSSQHTQQQDSMQVTWNSQLSCEILSVPSACLSCRRSAAALKLRMVCYGCICWGSCQT